MNPGFSSFVLNNPNENAAFLPFGSGSRACIGQKFVIQVVATLFASILEKYEVCARNQILLLLPFMKNEKKRKERKKMHSHLQLWNCMCCIINYGKLITWGKGKKERTTEIGKRNEIAKERKGTNTTYKDNSKCIKLMN